MENAQSEKAQPEKIELLYTYIGGEGFYEIPTEAMTLENAKATLNELANEYQQIPDVCFLSAMVEKDALGVVGSPFSVMAVNLHKEVFFTATSPFEVGVLCPGPLKRTFTGFDTAAAFLRAVKDMLEMLETGKDTRPKPN